MVVLVRFVCPAGCFLGTGWSLPRVGSCGTANSLSGDPPISALFVGRCDLALGLLMSLASCCEGSVNHWEWEGSSPLRGSMALGLAAARMGSGPSAERCCGARRARDCL